MNRTKEVFARIIQDRGRDLLGKQETPPPWISVYQLRQYFDRVLKTTWRHFPATVIRYKGKPVALLLPIYESEQPDIEAAIKEAGCDLPQLLFKPPSTAQ